MEDDNFELFPSKDLAEAFVQGFRLAIDLTDGHGTVINDPESLSTGEWRVNFGYGRENVLDLGYEG